MIHPNDPAFNHEWWNAGHPDEADKGRVAVGMTKREEFVKAAMMGLCGRSNVAPNVIAAKAVKIADAVIEEINNSERSQEPASEIIPPETSSEITEQGNHENA